MRRHLRLEIDGYEESIRRFLPDYDEMIARAAAVAVKGAPAHVVDLGAGTGALSQAVLERCATCRVSLIDVDPEMLDQARERLDAHASRTRFLRRSFYGALPRCDAVVASLALHHVPALAEKRALYRDIRAALSPGGVFVNADITMPTDAAARRADYETWAAHLTACGIPEKRAWDHFEEWAGEDVYFSLEEELAALLDAGLEAKCIWRVTPWILIQAVNGRRGVFLPGYSLQRGQDHERAEDAQHHDQEPGQRGDRLRRSPRDDSHQPGRARNRGGRPAALRVRRRVR